MRDGQPAAVWKRFGERKGEAMARSHTIPPKWRPAERLPVAGADCLRKDDIFAWYNLFH